MKIFFYTQKVFKCFRYAESLQITYVFDNKIDEESILSLTPKPSDGTWLNGILENGHDIWNDYLNIGQDRVTILVQANPASDFGRPCETIFDE